jgi:hypothetical protein
MATYYSFIFETVDAKISGDTFLSLDKASLEHYGLSTKFKTPLMKIIDEVVCNIPERLYLRLTLI